ncbi:GntR family transcriptional regulator [Actinoplanes sp. NBRC 14428]|uniref:DNA-binding transcriptional MocR family regulator n=1 Tax=Pseudosporangium ferrugineum TaxID=439699 RepID=A0A2T0RWX2_9ACTN|nr:aminotransferase class I/II-fold pyridoxal phosphate-dependent enzyme [Pseudosporangium ferrugineum]PRY25674.1 DNA-binding transcriptional MocR family regulator [Pseudosporangium ferrugineum]BCJ56281.1 GntR family transcriptional regulator [Actinoplanes sp. NBRC 14428]
MLPVIAGAVEDRSARGIAAAVSRLVTAGELPTGARLPTVRDVARELGVSPTTVSEAWRSLARAGAIQTRGRSGSYVAAPVLPRRRLRYAQLGAGLGPVAHDYSTGVPDYDLLPSMTGALRRIGDARLTTSYLEAAVLPPLETVLRQRWPYPPEQLTVVDGALDALDRITATLVRLGDHVLVENPAFPPVLDLLDAVGATVVGVPMDEHGLRPGELGAALKAYDPVAVFLQPRAHNPTGAGLSARRVSELADVLAGYPQVTIVEDDHAGDIATAPPVSLGTRLPDRTVHVAGFSKSHGPDLRLAALGGPAGVITAVADRRLLGPGWSSRLLQAVLLDLLTSPEAEAQVAAARDEYARRRAVMLAELAARDVPATAADGINLWMTVEDQQMAMLALAAHGIAVAPGAPFAVTPLGADHVRITAGLIRDGHADLADILAAAARAGARGSGSRSRPHPRGWR